MAPTWIIGGALLQKRKAIGLVSGLGLLFQVSMLFIGLIALVALRPFVSDQQFPVTASGRRANSTASKLRQHKPLSIASRTIAIVPNDDISAPRSCPPHRPELIVQEFFTGLLARVFESGLDTGPIQDQGSAT